MSVHDVDGDGARPPGRRYRRFLKSKRTWGVLAAAVVLGTGIAVPAASIADNPSGCDFAATGTTQSCSGPLSGSTFAGGDGNLLTTPTTFGTTDWQNVAGLNTGIDVPSGTSDNSFGQGTKEDNSNVTVVTGSIPPQKSDLTRFYEASEFANNNNFLYLAWERTNNLGSANMDFEINQKTQPNLTTTGPKTLNRTAGDLLVTFDFTNGGGKPTLNLLRWLTSASTPSGVPGYPTNVCLSANSFPCWGDEITLNSTNSIGAVNNLDAVTDPFVSNTPNNIGALRFGETAINLTAAGVFPAGTCEAFGSAFLKSRSSASFPAEVKDFVAPVPVNISNCGTVNIIKHTNPRGVNQDFGYTSTIPDPSDPNADPRTPQCSTDATPSKFTLNDKNGVDPASPITAGSANTEHCANVPAGSYTVTEDTPLPANFVLESLTCKVDGTAGSTGSQDGTNPYQANIKVQPGDTITCTYTNKQQLGAIKISKTSSKTGNNLAGAQFSITGPNGYTASVTTGSDGTVCVDGLAFGDYTVTETSPPTGFVIDDKSGHTVTVDNNATCADNPYGGESISFTDTPTADIQVNFRDGGSGETSGTITCDNTTGTGSDTPASGWDTSRTVTGVQAPTTVHCTITIDP
jgi:Prealbumin-like fold domain